MIAMIVVLVIAGIANVAIYIQNRPAAQDVSATDALWEADGAKKQKITPMKNSSP